ncbi:MAG: hypothetical protein IJR26_06355 [Bacteroidales bacterium]|nr:hypothetical protein [Bacteroidales bacterium]
MPRAITKVLHPPNARDWCASKRATWTAVWVLPAVRNIPLRAYNYVVNGKSAIEWIMERYCDKVDKKSGIRNDANQWGLEHDRQGMNVAKSGEHGNPKYPLELLQSIITLSLKTLDIVERLPKVAF